jgi:hypothetical protein
MPRAKRQACQVTDLGPSFLPEFTLSLAEGVEMTRHVALRSWRPFGFAQDMLGAIKFH